MEQQIHRDLTFKDYTSVLKRRAKLFSWTFAVGLTVGVAIAFGLPPIYESYGSILIEQPEVPEYLVRSTVTTLPDTRIGIISQRVMTQERLSAIVEKHNVYPEITPFSMRDAVLELSRNVTMGSVESAINDDAIGGATVTTAFTIGFGHYSPEIARAVARELVQLFLDENKLVREETASETRGFLVREAARIDEEIAKVEAELAEFKSLHADSLPTLQGLNLGSIERTERDLETVDREIRELREQRNLLQSELAQLSPYDVVLDDEGNRILSTQDRLKMLQRQLVQQLATYSADHPDVMKTRREIEALTGQSNVPGPDRSSLLIELEARRDELAAARQQYAPDHPDVRRLERVVANLEEAAARAPTSQRPLVAPPDNPAYIQRSVQLEGTEIELAAAVERRAVLQTRMTELEDRLARTPQVEQDYVALERRRELLVGQYNEIDVKLREAEIALTLESESKGERFTLLEAPQLPSLPSAPNRIAILLLAVVISFAVAAGATAVAEVSDTTVRNSRDVSELLQIPPVAVIPYIENQADVRARHFSRLVTAAGIFLLVAVDAYFVFSGPNEPDRQSTEES